MNIKYFHKCLFACFYTIIAVSPLWADDVSVVIASIPNPSYETSKWYGGSFTQVGNEVNYYLDNNQGYKVGYYAYRMEPEYDNVLGKFENCCIDSETSGKKWVIKPGDIKVTWKATNLRIGLPYWDDSDACEPQQNEWRSFEGVVFTHESGHYQVFKDFFTQDNIKEYYQLDTIDSMCETDEKADDEKAAAIAAYNIAMNRIRNEVHADYDEADDKYHKKASYRKVNVSISCQ